mgnify:CR=1 FL=1
MILYHGTSEKNAQRIMVDGFQIDRKYNWKVKSKAGLIYLSLAYAPFYAGCVKGAGIRGALIQVEVNEETLYPDEDYIMYTLGFPVYTQEQLNALDLEHFKSLYKVSLQYLGNACAKPEDIKILGVRYFSMERLLLVSDPTITPINFMIMGTYYQELTKWIYEGNKPEEFNKSIKDFVERT